MSCDSGQHFENEKESVVIKEIDVWGSKAKKLFWAYTCLCRYQLWPWAYGFTMSQWYKSEMICLECQIYSVQLQCLPIFFWQAKLWQFFIDLYRWVPLVINQCSLSDIVTWILLLQFIIILFHNSTLQYIVKDTIAQVELTWNICNKNDHSPIAQTPVYINAIIGSAFRAHNLALISWLSDQDFAIWNHTGQRFAQNWCIFVFIDACVVMNYSWCFVCARKRTMNSSISLMVWKIYHNLV